MTDDVLLRILVVAAVGAVSIGMALFARRGTSLLRRSVEVAGLGPGLVFFSSSACGTCARMRDRLRAWPDVVEVTYEEAGTGFPTQVDRVPAVALLDAAGRGWIAYGVVSERRLRRWVGP